MRKLQYIFIRLVFNALYSLPNGSCFGLTSSTVLKKGSDTSLDTALIGPRNAKLGWYDSTAKYFYQLGTEDA